MLSPAVIQIKFQKKYNPTQSKLHLTTNSTLYPIDSNFDTLPLHQQSTPYNNRQKTPNLQIPLNVPTLTLHSLSYLHRTGQPKNKITTSKHYYLSIILKIFLYLHQSFTSIKSSHSHTSTVTITPHT